MKKFTMTVLAALVAVALSIPVFACDVREEGAPLPEWVDPLTPRACLPHITPDDLPRPGWLIVYNNDGDLGYVDVQGRLRNKFGLIANNGAALIPSTDVPAYLTSQTYLERALYLGDL